MEVEFRPNRLDEAFQFQRYCMKITRHVPITYCKNVCDMYRPPYNCKGIAHLYSLEQDKKYREKLK